MKELSKDLRSALHIALAEARRAKDRAGGSNGPYAAKFDSLSRMLERALTDLERGRRPELNLVTKGTIDWIPDVDDPVVNALDEVEMAATRNDVAPA